MKKQLMLGLLSLATTPFIFAAPITSVDHTQLSLNDSLTLQITEDGNINDDPDLSPLNQDFNVVSTTTSQAIQIINNKTSQQKTWSITLTPKHTGNLVIPSLALGRDKTDPISLQVATAEITTADPNKVVSDATPNNKPTPSTPTHQNPPIFMQTSINPQTVYEGQAGLFTVKIFYNTSVREPALTIPNMGDVKLMHVGKDINQRTEVDGDMYQVLEQHYALIAEKDGVLDIESPVLQGYRLDISGYNAFNNPWQAFHISAPSVSLKVNTIPGMAKSTWWLPSSKVTLTDSWADNPPNFENGVPVTRTLTLTAQNVTADQLPQIAPDKNNGFQLYPDKPILKTDSNGFQLQATRVEKIAYLPNANGQFTIPAIRIDWWNTDDNTPQTVAIPAKTITIASNTNSSGDHAMMSPTVLSLQDNSLQPMMTQTTSWYKQPFVMLSLLLTFAWLFTLFLWWKTARPKIKAKVAAPHEEDVKTMRQLRTDLRKACQQNNAIDAKSALVAIGKELWPYETVLSVGDLAEKFQQSQTRELLQELESVLYKEATTWHGSQLWNLLDQEFRMQAKKSIDPTDVLPKLYMEEK